MLKKTQPKTYAEEIERLEKILKCRGTLSGQDRKFILEKIYFNHKKCSLPKSDTGCSRQENIKVDKGLQTSFLQTPPSKLSKPMKNQVFWLIHHESLVEAKKELRSAKKELRSLIEEDSLNVNRINHLMERTFIKRRDKILRKVIAVSEIKDEYPALFSLIQMKNEFARILHKGICERFFYNVRTHCKLLVENAEECIKKDIAHYLKKAKSKVGIKNIYMVQSVLLLPRMLGDKSFVIFTDKTHEEEPTEYPHIVAPSKHDVLFNRKTMKVVVEHVPICEQVSFLDALLCMVSSFYIFNIKYPDIYCNTLSVMDHLYLEEDEGNITDKAADFLCLLKSSAISS